MRGLKWIIYTICLAVLFSSPLGTSMASAKPLLENKPPPLARTGAFDVKVPLVDLVRPDQALSLKGYYPSDHTMSWRIFVPAPRHPPVRPGVMVYISPTRSGALPKQWERVLERENIIYISAHNAGNKTAARQRISNALFALSYVRATYQTNPDITLISGFSGSARMSSIILEMVPGLFNGAIKIGGAQDWVGPIEALQETLGPGAFVFITGKQDHARFETRRTFRQYRDAGLTRVKLIDNARLRHERPNGRLLAEALKFITASEP